MDTMTKDQFIAGYCERSKVTPEWLAQHYVAMPCACGDETCAGWAMVHNTPEMVALHLEEYARDHSGDATEVV